jgi:hypothetical protein
LRGLAGWCRKHCRHGEQGQQIQDTHEKFLLRFVRVLYCQPRMMVKFGAQGKR